MPSGFPRLKILSHLWIFEKLAKCLDKQFFYCNTEGNVAILSVIPYKKTFSVNSKFKVPTLENKLLREKSKRNCT